MLELANAFRTYVMCLGVDLREQLAVAVRREHRAGVLMDVVDGLFVAAILAIRPPFE